MAFINKEVKIGIIAILALAILYIGFIFLKGINLFSDTNVYYVKLINIDGLAPQSDVIVSGMKIGSVGDFEYNHAENNIIVSIEVNKDFYIAKGSTASLAKEMLGSTKLEINMPEGTNSYLQSGDTIKGTIDIDLMSTAAEIIPQVQNLLPKMDSILTSINIILANPSIKTSLHNIEELTCELKTTTNQVNSILCKDVPNILNKADNVCTNMEEITHTLKGVDIKAMEGNINNTMLELQLFANKLNNENSNLGLLLNDSSIYNNLDSTLNNASNLLKDLRLNPKRYVHFSIFGKKK
jgi:phospholipid/cholesterol/gamma-HCH transport system substrate-binding protein